MNVRSVSSNRNVAGNAEPGERSRPRTFASTVNKTIGQSTASFTHSFICSCISFSSFLLLLLFHSRPNTSTIQPLLNLETFVCNCSSFVSQIPRRRRPGSAQRRRRKSRNSSRSSASSSSSSNRFLLLLLLLPLGDGGGDDDGPLFLLLTLLLRRPTGTRTTTTTTTTSFPKRPTAAIDDDDDGINIIVGGDQPVLCGRTREVVRARQSTVGDTKHTTTSRLFSSHVVYSRTKSSSKSRFVFFSSKKVTNFLMRHFFFAIFFSRRILLCSFLGFVVSKKRGRKKNGLKRGKKELSRISIGGSLKYHSRRKKDYYTLSVWTRRRERRKGARVEGNDDNEEGLLRR